MSVQPDDYNTLCAAVKNYSILIIIYYNMGLYLLYNNIRPFAVALRSQNHLYRFAHDDADSG